jgi:hypothetical protein
MHDWNDDELTGRAFRAYFRAGNTMQPANSSGVEVHNGKRYVVLRNTYRVLAVYRVSSRDGVHRLRALRRWPPALQVL